MLRFFTSYILLIMFLISAQVIEAQTDRFQKAITVKAGSSINVNDTLIYIERDTVIFVHDTYMPDDITEYEQSLEFYDSLKARASGKRLIKTLYDLAVVPPPKSSDKRINRHEIEEYTDYAGMTIRQIIYRRLNAFGSSIYDPEASLQNENGFFLNRTHIKTRQLIIKNYLLFEEGDSLYPLKLTESERILRKLSYINDARIIIIPINEEEVDAVVVTKDVYSLGLMTEIHGWNVGQAKIFDINALGFGHELEFFIPWDYRNFSSTGFGTTYRIKNISHSLIDAKINYKYAFGKRNISAEISRDFLTPFTKYAGRLLIAERYILEDLDLIDRLSVPEPVEFNQIDAWFGRSFVISQKNMTRIVFSGRYINNNVYNKPEIPSNAYYKYQRFKNYLGSFTLVQQKYLKSNLIYSYGRNEDIPYGGLIELTYGKEFNEFSERDYFGIRAALGNFINPVGYIYGQAEYNTFINGSVYEQGYLNLNMHYISNLLETDRNYLRIFAELDYSAGINRFTDEYFDVNDNNGLRGFRNDSIYPDQRMYLNLETVAFNKKFFYGFRFAVFGFADMVLVSKNRNTYNFDRLISGIGLGIRVRNENLIFPTFVVRLGYYPYPPQYSRLRYIDATNEELLILPGFDPVAPEVTRLR